MKPKHLTKYRYCQWRFMENYTRRIGGLGMTITSSKTFYMGSSCFQSILNQAVFNRSCLRNSDNVSISSSYWGPAEDYQYLDHTFIGTSKLDDLMFRIYEVRCLFDGIFDIWKFGIHYET